MALTGGTGFLGQGIIEKLLYSCPEVKKIIVLIRNKRGVTPEDRLKSLANKPVSLTNNLKQFLIYTETVVYFS